MTTSDYKKVLAQLKPKPAKYKKFIKHNAPKERSCGRAKKSCRRCGRARAHIDKYGLDLCRQCFRNIAASIGFKKFN